MKYADFRIVLTAPAAHTRISGHRVAGRISVHTVRGHIRMRALGGMFDLPAGSLLALDRGVLHEVEVLEDSAVLLTIACPGRDGAQAGWKHALPSNGEPMSQASLTRVHAETWGSSISML
jgi:quercetin dioxygenase-like cupin family protein